MDEEADSGYETDAEAAEAPEPEAAAYSEPPQRTYTLGDLFQVGITGELRLEQHASRTLKQT